MNYIIFDLEATCEDENITPDYDNETIEIGAIKINEKGEIIGEFNCFIKPKNYILTDFCKNLTSITQEDVNNGLDFPKAIESFSNWASDNNTVIPVYCSWGFYDKTQIQKDCNRYRIKKNYIVNHISIKHQYSEIVLKTKKGFGMERALRKEGLSLDGTHHRGIDDAKNIGKIFIKHKDKWLIP